MTINPTAGLAAVSLLLLACTGAEGSSASYPWLAERQAARTIASAIAPPPGSDRVAPVRGSFAAWLAALPLKPEGTPVRLFTGADKFRQDVHAAVVDIDVGTKNLQQCADAVIRLRAEWLRAAGRGGEIGFDYTGGGRVAWTRWAQGERPAADGKRWTRRAKADDSYAAFRRYLEQVFAYAGTYSLERELRRVPIGAMQIGDVFIKGGFPGHAVLVADMAHNPKTGERHFLLLQSFMPAQDIHVLKNPRDPAGGPWYPLEPTGDVATPEWTFSGDSLRRWP